MMSNLNNRIVNLEEAARNRPQRTGYPDPSRLTVFEIARLTEITEKADANGGDDRGLDALTNNELDTAIDITCRLWDRHPDYERNRAGERYPWPNAEMLGR